MKRAVQLAALLYPHWWRDRYAAEFEALLEDARPSLAAALDIAKGALLMQIVTWTPARAFALFAIAGFVSAGAATFLPPPSVSSRALIRVPGAEDPSRRDEQTQRLAAAAQTNLSMPVLLHIMRDYDLYQDQFRRQTIDKVLEQMRADLRIEPVRLGPSLAIGVEFSYSDPLTAQRIAGVIAQRLVDADREAVGDARWEQAFQVLDPPSMPGRHWLTRPRLLARVLGIPTGLLTGAAAALLLFRRRRLIAPQ